MSAHLAAVGLHNPKVRAIALVGGLTSAALVALHFRNKNAAAAAAAAPAGSVATMDPATLAALSAGSGIPSFAPDASNTTDSTLADSLVAGYQQLQQQITGEQSSIDGLNQTVSDLGASLDAGLGQLSQQITSAPANGSAILPPNQGSITSPAPTPSAGASRPAPPVKSSPTGGLAGVFKNSSGTNLFYNGGNPNAASSYARFTGKLSNVRQIGRPAGFSGSGFKL